MAFRQEVRSGKKKKKTELSPETEFVDDRLQAVRNTFFEKDGLPLFDSARGSDFVPRSGGSKFGSKDFWEERYSKHEGDYDWFGTWNSQSQVQFKRHVEEHLPDNKVNPVLVIGCGNSRLTSELLQDGYTNISNIDISTVVIEQMARKFEGQKGVDFQVMDITNLTFPEQLFDVVFDKGALDALYLGGDGKTKVKVAVPGIYRVLRPGGILISMTFGVPAARKELNVTSPESHSAKSAWKSFTTVMVPKHDSDDRGSPASYFYAYVARK